MGATRGVCSTTTKGCMRNQRSWCTGHEYRLQFISLLSAVVFIVPITVARAQTVWWNTLWKYRVPVSVSANGSERYNKPAEVSMNFTQQLQTLGTSGTLDEQSLRVIEVDQSGATLDAAVPFQFDKDADYDATTKASGTLIIMMTGKTQTSGTRLYHVYFELTGGSFSPAIFPPQVSVANDFDEGENCFRVDGQGITYFYQKNAGAFSSLLDANSNDWIGYNPTVGSGSAGEFRGIPNAIYPEGYFHPGATNATSTLVSQGPLKATIHTVTNDNKWECTWEFFPRYARLTMLKADHTYWLLYEGTPGGSINENSDLVIRSTGDSSLAGVAWAGDIPSPEWLYFTDPAVSRSLFFAHHEDDNQVDAYYSLNAEMTVFGFGRDGSTTSTYLSAVPQHMTIGLFGRSDFAHSRDSISSAYRTLNVSQGTPEKLGVQVPVLVSPANNAVEQSVPERLIWNTSPSATSYDLQVDTDSLFTGTMALNDSSIADTTALVGQIQAGTRYYWRVRARSGALASNFSSARSFTTALPTPALLYPQDRSIGVPQSPAFQWMKVQGAIGYSFELATDSTFATGVAKNDSTVIDTFRVVSDLPQSTRYFWRTRARGQNGGSIYSPTWSFRTTGPIPSAVQLISPPPGIEVASDSVGFVWNQPAPLPDRYWFEIAIDSLFQFEAIDSSLTDTMTAVTQLLNNHRYWWRVRGGNLNGWGTFSEVRSFSVTVTGVESGRELPREFQLFQNYPNPFNPSTTITYALPRGTYIRLDVFNVLGEKIATLVDGQEGAGIHAVTFAAGSVGSGVYFYRMIVDGHIIEKKMMLTK